MTKADHLDYLDTWTTWTTLIPGPPGPPGPHCLLGLVHATLLTNPCNTLEKARPNFNPISTRLLDSE